MAGFIKGNGKMENLMEMAFAGFKIFHIQEHGTKEYQELINFEFLIIKYTTLLLFIN